MSTFSKEYILQHAVQHAIELKSVQLDSIESVLAKRCSMQFTGMHKQGC
jgi:hypothetical protein